MNELFWLTFMSQFQVSEEDYAEFSVKHTDLQQLFDDQTERSYSDIDVMISGIEKPFKLHRVVLGRASNTFNSLFHIKENAY